MLAFPQWSLSVGGMGGVGGVGGDGCRSLRWAPPSRFAPYIARPVLLPRSSPPLQVDDEDSSGGSSPDRDVCEGGAGGEGGEGGEVCVCGWRGCGVHFMSVARLSAHVARAHAQPHHDGLFYCGWRGCTRPQRGFNARYKMLVHVRTHTNERPHICTQCHKSFSRAENLKIHLRSHSGEKPYVCPYEGCGKAYSNSSDRFKHTRTHTVDKPYCCKVAGCNKRYTDPSSLRKHVKTYKHFTPKTSSESSPEQIFLTSDNMLTETSPLRDTSNDTFKPYLMDRRSPMTSAVPVVCPMRSLISPSFTSIPPMTESIPPTRIGSPIRYSPSADRVTYMKPLEPAMYPMRVPSYEMSYLEYTQMYEHAYRTYYSNSIPLQRAAVYDKMYAYEDKPYCTLEETRLEPSQVARYSPTADHITDVPLNLKRVDSQSCRAQTMLVRPIEESMELDIVKCMDLPLDLSTKS